MSSREQLIHALERSNRRAHAQSALFDQAVADRIGMSLTDVQCLELLNLEGPMTAGRIAELTGLTTGAVTFMVDRLEKAGLVRRDRDAADRRKVIVRTVPGVSDLIEPFYGVLGDSWEANVAGYTDEEIAFATRYMQASYEVTTNAIAHLRQSDGPKDRLKLATDAYKARLKAASDAFKAEMDAYKQDMHNQQIAAKAERDARRR